MTTLMMRFGLNMIYMRVINHFLPKIIVQVPTFTQTNEVVY